MQSGHEGPAALGQGDAKLPERADAELGEHLAQMPLDRAGAEEQLRPDLGVRQAIPGQPGDLLLLPGEFLARLGAALARLLPGSGQFPAGALGEGLHADGGEQVVGGAQLLTRIAAAAPAAQPLAIQQLRPAMNELAGKPCSSTSLGFAGSPASR